MLQVSEIRGSALEETVDISIFTLKHRIPTTASKTVLMELKDTKGERMMCAMNLKEQGHVPEVTVSICTVVIALERKDLSHTIGRYLAKQLVTLGQHQTEERELDKDDRISVINIVM